MLVLHIYIKGKSGAVERSYDFLRADGKDTFEGCDIVIPYDKEIAYPISEMDAMAIVSTKQQRGDH